MTAAVALAAAFLSAGANAAPGMRVGIYDEAQTLFGPAAKTFALYRQLHVQELRVNLYWGGKHGVARRRPSRAADPGDPAYDWSLYDRTVREAAANGVQVLFSIYGTPPWANGGQAQNVAPKLGLDLRNFAYAAARRYSGAYPGPDGKPLPAVHDWLAWNEPNNPVFLTPQYRRAGGGWTVESAFDYTKICNAVYSGVHATLVTGERVACGGTAPRGNNDPSSSRASVSPLAFLRAVKADGLRSFDAWAHNPYYSAPSETPATKPSGSAVTLGNIGDLIALVTKLYGAKRIWITEYGYQTNPPDPVFGVSPAKQALYLSEAFAIARANPRIDVMLWFLLEDEPNLSGWQSGLLTSTGKKKPAFAAFQRMAAAGARR